MVLSRETAENLTPLGGADEKDSGKEREVSADWNSGTSRRSKAL